MNDISRKVVFAITALIQGVAVASAATIPVDSYTYQNPTEWLKHWSTDPAEDGQTVKRLTDGVTGPWSFLNLATVGFQHNPPGDSTTPVPMVDFDLGGTYRVGSAVVNYIIDHASFIFAPQTSMEILASTDGTNFSPVALKNDFPTVAESQAAMTTGVQTAEFDLGGVVASHLRLDVRTWATFYFMSEVTFDAIPEPASAMLLGVGLIGASLAIRRRT